MNGVKIEWYRFVDKYDSFHKHGFRSGHNFLVRVEKEVTDELIAHISAIVPDVNVFSKQSFATSDHLYVAVESDAEAVALKMGII
jgi:hypothetical protein